MTSTDQSVLDAIQTIRTAAADMSGIPDYLDAIITKMGLRQVPDELFDDVYLQVSNLRGLDNTKLQHEVINAIGSLARDLKDGLPMSKDDALWSVHTIFIHYTALTVYMAEQAEAIPLLEALRADIATLANCLLLSVPEITEAAHA